MPSSSFALAIRSLDFIRPQRRRLACVVCLALVLSALSALDPLLIKYLIDQLGRGDGGPRFALAMVSLLVLELVRAGLQAVMGVWSWDIRLGVDFRVRERLVGKLNSLPLSFHQREGVGGTMTRINQAISAYVAAFADTAFNLSPTLLYLVLALAAMMELDARLALLVVLIA